MDIESIMSVRTDAGMATLWCSAAFADISDYDSWEGRVNDRLVEAIGFGELVPINIESDGAWGIRLSTDLSGLTERERRYAVVTSEPYLLVVSGGEICLGGIEHVGSAAYAALRIQLPDGRYSVSTTMVAWDEEPGSLDTDGKPTSDALPDFVVQIRAEEGSETYRTIEVTFEAPR